MCSECVGFIPRLKPWAFALYSCKGDSIPRECIRKIAGSEQQLTTCIYSS